MSANLKKIMFVQGRSQEWLSRQTGLSRYKISRIICGTQKPDKAEMKIIAEAFQIPPESIFFDCAINVNIKSINEDRKPSLSPQDTPGEE